MDIDTAWQIIEDARTTAGPDADDETLADALSDRLTRHSPEEIIAFAERFEQLQDRLDRDDVYMAAFLITNHLTDGIADDSLADFQAAIVGLGRLWYDRVLTDPDTLAEHPLVQAVAAGTADDDAMLAESFQYAPLTAYEEVTGEDEDVFWQKLQDADLDDDWDEDDFVPRRLPKLSALFPDNADDLDLAHPELTGA